MTVHAILGGEPQIEGQDLKEETINEAFNRYAHGPILVIQDRDLTAPPGGENEGENWLVAATGSGAWDGHDGEVATWFCGWRFRDLIDGEILMIVDEGSTYSISMWYNNLGTLNKMWEI